MKTSTIRSDALLRTDLRWFKSSSDSRARIPGSKGLLISEITFPSPSADLEVGDHKDVTRNHLTAPKSTFADMNKSSDAISAVLDGPTNARQLLHDGRASRNNDFASVKSISSLRMEKECEL